MRAIVGKARILYVIGSSGIGGAENFVRVFLKFLDNGRFEKYVVCPKGGYYADEFGSLAKKALFIDAGRSFMNPATILRVSKFVKDNDIDIIHSMLYGSDFCACFAGMLSGRRPYILNTINGHNFLVLKSHSIRLKRRMASFVYRFIYRYSDKLIAVCESVRSDLIERKGIKAAPEKIETVLAAGIASEHDNISQEYADYLHGLYSAGRELIISAVGMLNDTKDYDTMLEAFYAAAAKEPKIRLFIAGDGPERERLHKKILKLGLKDKVYLLGALEEAKKRALLYLTDIFLMSSATEGCPTALLEAMSYAKPIIATQAGGIPEIISHGQTGLLAPVRNPERLAQEILFLARDPDMRILLGKNAREVFQQRFTQRHMLRAYENIYNDLLTRR